MLTKKSSRLFLIFLIFGIFVSNHLLASVLISSGVLPVGRWSTWIVKNWPTVALVFSEIAGVLPGRVSGIVSAFISIGSSLIKKKSNS